MPLNADDAFPVHGKMRIRVDFWKKVYTEITQHEAYLHDSEDLSLIYRKIELPNSSSRARRRLVKNEKIEIKKLIESIAKKDGENLTEKEKQIVLVIGDRSSKELGVLARQIRFQQGMRDRYLEGFKRSFLYIDRMREIIRSEGVPETLAYLPHVESSFNYRAYSKVGAAGMWQFMRATARLFRLDMNYVLDERRDPIKATHAAAKLLRSNYERLEAWPLAITAYNHGPRSIEVASRNLKTKDISVIVENYDGRRFGFASKNFYATFMATVEVSRDYEKYFGKIEHPEPLKFSELMLAKRYTVRQLSEATGISIEEIKQFNPELRKSAFRSWVYLPKNYSLKLPAVSSEKLVAFRDAISKIKTDQKKAVASSSSHVVERGESLYLISKLYRVSITDLIALNQIENPSRVMPGTNIKIPGSGVNSLVAQKTKNQPKVTEKINEKAVEVAVSEKPETVAVASNEKPVEPEKEQGGSKIANWFSSIFARSPAKDEGKESGIADEELAQVENETINKNEDPKKSVSVDLYKLESTLLRDGVYQVYVEPEETIGHYADWVNTKSSEIRRLNNMSFGEPIIIGQKIRIPSNPETIKLFNSKRMEYHIAIQEDFYTEFRVAGERDVTIKRGQTLAYLARKNDVPIWLIRKVQSPEFSGILGTGQKIKLPIVESIRDSESISEEGSSSE